MIKWKFWKQKHSVCKECGVHFEPVTGYESRWGDLCADHRKVVRDRDEKKDAVLVWAAGNWEKLFTQMEAERESNKAQYQNACKANLQQMAAMQQAGLNSQQRFMR